MPVVAMKPARQVLGPVSGGVEGGGVSPLAQRRLDEALGLAIGSRSIGPGEEVLEAELTAGQSKNIGAETGPIIGHDALKFYCEALIMGGGLAQESRRRNALLVGEDGGVSQAGMIVDGDKNKVITSGPDGITSVAGDAKAGTMDTGTVSYTHLDVYKRQSL